MPNSMRPHGRLQTQSTQPSMPSYECLCGWWFNGTVLCRRVRSSSCLAIGASRCSKVFHTLHTTTPQRRHSATRSLAHLPTLPLVIRGLSRVEGTWEAEVVLRCWLIRCVRWFDMSVSSFVQWRVCLISWERYWIRLVWNWRQVRERSCSELRSRLAAIWQTML